MTSWKPAGTSIGSTTPGSPTTGCPRTKLRLCAGCWPPGLVSSTGPLLRVPATGDLFGPWLYVVNARFDVTPTPTTGYNVVRLRA